MKFIALFFAAFLFITPAFADTHGNTQDLENTLHMQLKNGVVVIQLRPDLAPRHVERIKELTRNGFYNGVVFHRVIEGFMAQTGDPTGTGRGGSGQHIKAEFTNTPFKRGTIGMARAQDPHSADSQFFINFTATPFLNGKYTCLLYTSPSPRDRG